MTKVTSSSKHKELHSITSASSRGWGGARRNAGSKLHQKKQKTIRREEAAKERSARSRQIEQEHIEALNKRYEDNRNISRTMLLPGEYYELAKKNASWDLFPDSGNDTLKDYCLTVDSEGKKSEEEELFTLEEEDGTDDEPDDDLEDDDAEADGVDINSILR